TDIIVGFPGETEEDFAETLRVVEEARFASAYTFQYSIRPGTPAATMADQLPKEVVQERFERLAALQERISEEEAQKLVGTPIEVLVATGEGRRDQRNHRMSGRSEDNRLVHFDVPEGPVPRPGDVVSVVVTRATPHYVIAAPAGEALPIRRTRAGDAWDRAEAASCAVPEPSSGARTVNLGLPSLRPE
ncbi:MAG TPA: tRNA (N6-isopentenyl adenosine(37)-C2)-methylthiotransferase MiaB, partial [Protaetiibacter sp.]|nr:tRNA (N6-isopentenyl adenosine(37)-C2)-methylthiotransferase MiaB [Protaetiibacter sp.]